MSDGSFKNVQDIGKGDSVKTSEGDSAKIVCVVKTLTNGRSLLVDLNGLKVI